MRGLELAQADSQERARLQRCWAEVLSIENHYREAAALWKRHSTLLEQGDRRSAARAMGQLAANRAFMGEPAFDLWAASVQLLDDDGPSEELVVLLNSLAGAASCAKAAPQSRSSRSRSGLLT